MKVYALKWSPSSLEDLDSVWDEVWDACRDPETTDKYLTGLRKAVQEKCKAPKSGSPVNFMGEFTGIYRVQFKKYVVFYRIMGDRIEVARVLYAGSDYMKTLFGKSEYDLEDIENDGKEYPENG